MRYSQEHRRAISKAMRGRRHTPEHRRHIAEALEGRTFSDEHRAALSRAMTERWQRIREERARLDELCRKGDGG